eukprot:9915549-Alexandrium_andersonii.AAC.1
MNRGAWPTKKWRRIRFGRPTKLWRKSSGQGPRTCKRADASATELRCNVGPAREDRGGHAPPPGQAGQVRAEL